MSMAVKDKCIDKRLLLVSRLAMGAWLRTWVRYLRPDNSVSDSGQVFSSCIDIVSKISAYEKTMTSLNVPNLMGQQGPDVVPMIA